MTNAVGLAKRSQRLTGKLAERQEREVMQTLAAHKADPDHERRMQELSKLFGDFGQ